MPERCLARATGVWATGEGRPPPGYHAGPCAPRMRAVWHTRTLTGGYCPPVEYWTLALEAKLELGEWPL
jgi:hypothetical protein